MHTAWHGKQSSLRETQFNGVAHNIAPLQTLPCVNLQLPVFEFSLVSLPLNMFVHLAIFYYLDHLRTFGFPTNRCGASSP